MQGEREENTSVIHTLFQEQQKFTLPVSWIRAIVFKVLHKRKDNVQLTTGSFVCMCLYSQTQPFTYSMQFVQIRIRWKCLCLYVLIVIAFAARFFIITIENKSSERKKCIRFLHTDILILTKTITYKSLKKMFNSQNNYSVA